MVTVNPSLPGAGEVPPRDDTNTQILLANIRVIKEGLPASDQVKLAWDRIHLITAWDIHRIAACMEKLVEQQNVSVDIEGRIKKLGI